jgi:hypothetical protein
LEHARARGLDPQLCAREVLRLEALGAACGLALLDALEPLEGLFIFDGWRDEVRPAELALEAANLAAEGFRRPDQAVIFLTAARRAVESRRSS